MLVAQKRYSYDQQPDYDEVQRQQNKVREVVVTRRGAIRKFKAVCALTLIFALCLFILFRYTQINEHNQKISKLKAELSHLGKVNSQLQVELDRQTDLKAIEQIAIQELGMQYPDKSQTVYVQLEKKDFTEVPEEVKGKQQGSGVFASVTQGITEFVKYLY